MDKVLVVFGAGTLVAYVALGIYRPESAVRGLDFTAEMFVQALPWIIVSMFAAGLLGQLIDPTVVAGFLGKDAGIRGVFIGTGLGLFGTGSRWAVYPISAELLAADASTASVFSFLTAWQLVSLPRIPAEIPFLGIDFTVIRAVTSILVAVIGGLIILLFRW